MERRIWQKTLAAGLAILAVSGAVPIQPFSQMYHGVAVTANAEGNADYTFVPAKAETCTENGNIAYYTDPDGNAYTLSDNGYTRISAEETVIAARGHSYGAPE